MSDTQDRIHGVVFGLAYGEGIALPSAVHRLGILAPKRIARMKTLGEFADEKKQTSRPFPYTHAQPGHMLNPSPSDDSEWFTFVADYFLNNEDSDEVWLNLAKNFDAVRARTGTKIALKNLANGIGAPASGHDNPHYFDDISMIRACAIAVLYYKDKSKMQEALTRDLTLTHSEDGLYCAYATANLFASLLRGETKYVAIEEALSALPPDSWSLDLVTRALALTQGNSNTLSRAMDLEQGFLENVYAYPVSAPETLGLLLAHFSNTNSAEDLVFSGLLHKRKLDSLPALMGALAGASFGSDWIPKQGKSESVVLEGVCIPDLKGYKLLDLANRLAATK